MLIREEVLTRATPERVWQLLSDPSLHGRWNEKIVETEVFSSGAPSLGARYRVAYVMSGRRSDFTAEITEFTPSSRWVARLEERNKGDGSNFSRYMVESYVVTRRRNGTHVRHEVRIHHPGINIFLRALIWFIMTFGHPVGPTIMQRFADLAENGDAGSLDPPRRSA